MVYSWKKKRQVIKAILLFNLPLQLCIKYHFETLLKGRRKCSRKHFRQKWRKSYLENYQIPRASNSKKTLAKTITSDRSMFCKPFFLVLLSNNFLVLKSLFLDLVFTAFITSTDIIFYSKKRTYAVNAQYAYMQP